MYDKMIDVLGMTLFFTISIGGFFLGIWAVFWGPTWLSAVFWALTPFAEIIILGAWISAIFDSSDLTFAMWATGTRVIIWVGLLTSVALSRN